MSRSDFIEDIYPLSPMQEGMLFHTLHEPESGMYLEQLICTLHGELDIGALSTAWQRVVDRHPVLRTAFSWKLRDKPFQIVHRKVKVSIEELDWRSLTSKEQFDAVVALLKADRLKGYDLAKPPLMRLVLARTGEAEYQFVWSHHHIQTDRWCLSRLFKEVFAFYDASRRGEDLILPPARPYSAYINWLKSQNMAAAEAFWRTELKGFTAPTTFDVLTPQGEATSGHRTCSLDLTVDETAALSRLARQLQLTVNTIVQGAWAVLLSRYCGSDDVVFGTTVSGRPAELAGVEDIVGLFINTLPVRVQVDGSRRVGDWLQEMQRRQVDMRQYEYTPLSKIQAWSDVPRGVPMCESFLIFFNQSLDIPRDQNSSLDVRDVGFVERTGLPLTLNVVPGETLTLKIDYDATRFHAGDMNRMAGHLRSILVGMTDASRRVSELEMLTGEERRQLLFEWNDTDVALPADKCFPEIFADQARNSPDAIAVRSSSDELTYGELNSRSNSMARVLVEHGVGPDVLVALLAERDTDFVVAMLAILKAGGAYLPLDPRHPAHRHEQVIEKSRSAIVIASRMFSDAATTAVANVQPDARPLLVSLEELLQAERDTGAIAPRCTQDDIAYVMFTSGSTGLPKGAMIEHRGMLNHLQAKVIDLELTADDVIAQNATQSFDISVWQTFAALVTGGRVEIYADGVAHDPKLLLQRMESDGITILETVPSLLRLMLDELEALSTDKRPRFASLRRLISNAEALPPTLCARWFALYPNVPMINTWGATECSDDVTHLLIEHTPGDELAYVPLGFKLSNIRLYIVDSAMRPVPVGIPGELCIAGISVGRGYLHDPERTANAFVSDPFSDDAGARLYKTGDLGRYLPNGNIEFLGRMDHQVKVRGNRVELGEIESVLRQHPSVRETIVVAREDVPGVTQLVAYLVTDDDAVSMNGGWRGYLNERLPEYMVPSAFVQLAAMPLNANGKVDRKALPAPIIQRQEMESEYEAPNSTVQHRLADIWSQALHLDRVGIHDNFFELGGDSILSIQIVARANQAGLPITTRHVFEQQTISKLAAVVDDASLEMKADAVASTIDYKKNVAHLFDSEEVEDAYPLSPLQHGMLFHSIYEPDSGAYIAQTSRRVKIENAGALEQAWHWVVEQHQALRTSIAWEELETPLQVVHKDVKAPIRWDDWRGSSTEEQQSRLDDFLREDRATPFDLSRAPLMRLTLIRLAERDYQLTWTSHHLLLDGWSVPIVTKDLLEAFEAYSRDSLPEKKTRRPYRDYIAWLENQDLDAAEDFWRTELRGFDTPTDLKLIRPSVEGASGYRMQWLTLTTDETSSLQQMARQHQLTLNTVVQGAWALLLSHLSGVDDIVFGTTVSGRPAELAGVEEMVGLFINTLPVRVSIGGEIKAGEWLKNIQARQAEMRQYEYSPLAKVQSWSDVPRGLPLFESAVVFQNFPIDDEANGQDRQVEVRNSYSAIQSSHPLTVGAVPGSRMFLYLLYDGGRFDTEAIRYRLDQLTQVLKRLAVSSLASVKDFLSDLASAEREVQIMKNREHVASNLKSFIKVKPKPVRLSEESLIETRFLDSEQTLPLIIRPRIEDVDLIAWARTEEALIRRELLKYGAILFRGFNVSTDSEFGDFVRVLSSDLLDYREGSTPRTALGNKLYSSTEYPADQYIPLHNEMSYSRSWPAKVWFYCAKAAEQGGRTPIADSRKVFARLDPRIRERLIEKKVLYVRNFGKGVDLSWQKVFMTTSREEVERYCRSAMIDFEWKGDEQLRTRQVCQAAYMHPETREMVWFNQAHLFNVSNHDPEIVKSLLSVFSEEDLPRNTYYGDGTPLESSVLEEIRGVYKEAELSFPWQQGDVLLLDNMLTAHGRTPFAGTRRVVVAMADLITNREP